MRACLALCALVAACADDIVVEVGIEATLDTAGVWSIRVHGRRVGSGPDALIEQTYPLTVD